MGKCLLVSLRSGDHNTIAMFRFVCCLEGYCYIDRYYYLCDVYCDRDIKMVRSNFPTDFKSYIQRVKMNLMGSGRFWMMRAVYTE